MRKIKPEDQRPLILDDGLYFGIGRFQVCFTVDGESIHVQDTIKDSDFTILPHLYDASSFSNLVSFIERQCSEDAVSNVSIVADRQEVFEAGDRVKVKWVKLQKFELPPDREGVVDSVFVSNNDRVYRINFPAPYGNHNFLGSLLERVHESPYSMSPLEFFLRAVRHADAYAECNTIWEIASEIIEGNDLLRVWKALIDRRNVIAKSEK